MFVLMKHSLNFICNVNYFFINMHFTYTDRLTYTVLTQHIMLHNYLILHNLLIQFVSLGFYFNYTFEIKAGYTWTTW